ncbi:hypothetical protein ABFS82_02G072900 [Erythranthe guttata]
MSKLSLSLLVALFCFTLISGSRGEKCEVTIEQCSLENKECDSKCLAYITPDNFLGSECFLAPRHTDEYYCRCFYKCAGTSV